MRRIACVMSMLIAVLFSGVSSAETSLVLSQRTQDAFLHVVAHEIGHAMLREFDLPILGPEEDIADDFATIYVHLMLPDRAADIIEARARQNMADGDVPGMFSEYRSDDQRAGRSVCLLYGQDTERYQALARKFGLDGDEASTCRDFSTEVGRSWRRIIEKYRMPENVPVTEASFSVAETQMARMIAESGAVDQAFSLLSAIDWHSRVTLSIAQCDGSGGWSRNGRRITICDQYIERFEAQLRQ